MPLPEEPAGLVVTRTAGLARFEATLTWRTPEASSGPGLVAPVSCGQYRLTSTETEGPETATREVRGEVRAFRPGTVSRVLEETLRALMRAAALSEAVLEMRALRTAPPLVSDSEAVEALARDLWRAGRRVEFGRSWTVGGPDEGVRLGTGGETGILTFLREHPAWATSDRGI